MGADVLIRPSAFGRLHTARVDRRSTPTECTRSSHRTCRGGCPHPPVGLWPLVRLRADRRSTPTECTRSSHRTCRGGCPHPPVGLWPLARHGSIGDRPLHTTPVGADYISARSSNDFGGASPGRIYNAPLHPRPEIALVGADVLIRPSAFGRLCGTGRLEIDPYKVHATPARHKKAPLHQGELFCVLSYAWRRVWVR